MAAIFIVCLNRIQRLETIRRLLASKAPSRGKIVAGLALLVAIVVVAIGWIGWEQIYHCFVAIGAAGASNWRVQMLRDLRQAWKQFPLFGTGLGTHALVFPMF